MRKGYTKVCPVCGKKFRTNNKNQVNCSKRCSLIYREQKKGTLCWRCKNTYDICPWFSENPSPYPGWVAERRDVDGEESYKVIECPGFESTKWV